MYQIIREPNESTEIFLGRLFYKFGDRNVSLSYNYLNSENDLCWSKWISYEVLMHLHWHEIVPGTRVTRQQFYDLATHRTILDIEVLFDIDDILLKGVRKFSNILNKSKIIYKILKQKMYNPVVYYTQNKSYHLSVVIPKLRDLSPYQRSKYKGKMLWAVGADLQKKSERCMISLEGSLHYKSKKEKIKVSF